MGSVTIGSDTYNIYGSLAGANTYLAARIGSEAWTAATETTKEQGLVSGTRLIQTWLASRGYTVDPASAVDIEIEQANYELAFALVADPSVITASTSAVNTRRLKAGSAEIEYFRPGQGGRFPTLVQALLNAWLTEQGGAPGFGLPYASGTCETSSLTGDDYGLTEGY